MCFVKRAFKKRRKGNNRKKTYPKKIPDQSRDCFVNCPVLAKQLQNALLFPIICGCGVSKSE